MINDCVIRGRPSAVPRYKLCDTFALFTWPIMFLGDIYTYICMGRINSPASQRCRRDTDIKAKWKIIREEINAHEIANSLIIKAVKWYSFSVITFINFRKPAVNDKFFECQVNHYPSYFCKLTYRRSISRSFICAFSFKIAKICVKTNFQFLVNFYSIVCDAAVLLW